ncbi:hypothetical protein Y032_0050g2011 [Ancylostoma ceylanicum]|uniref:Uncharacterized protein n=1 Tax=Ancylostoma ceylanicum TaxID=53326 RepID=A0A016U9V2_9BILA|nr:hypothetical protein Y032_0050g2011 [Ancylostoma ceylanicum]
MPLSTFRCNNQSGSNFFGVARVAPFRGAPIVWRDSSGGTTYRQARPRARYYHTDYGHATRLSDNQCSDNSSTPPKSAQSTTDALAP